MATSKIPKETAERLVWSADANAYNTYALALAAMETAYNTLSDAQKRNSYIIYNGTTKASLDMTTAKVFIRMTSDSAGLMLVVFDLKNHERVYDKLTPSGNTITDQSANAQSQSLALYTIF